MHVACFINNYLPRIGGVELHVHALARHLVAAGHRVTVVTLAPTAGDSVEDGIRVIRLKESTRIGDVLAFPTPPASVEIGRFLAQHDVDLVAVHTRFFPMTWLGGLAGRREHVPVVLTEHGSDYVASGPWFVRAAARLVDRTLGRYSHRHADAVLAVSEDVARFVRRLSGVEAELFYNAIELLPSQARPARPSELVFVGRLVAGKGWRTFLETVDALRAQGFDVHGTVLGCGPDEHDARRLASDAVQVIGRVRPEEVAGYLSGATLVNPTTLSEGFQTTLLEALAAGGRVVSYRVPGAQALVDDGAPVTITATRDLAALVESVASVLGNPEPAYPRDKLEKWSWDARSRQFTAIAERLIAQSRYHGTAH